MSSRSVVRLTLATSVAALILCAGRAPERARADGGADPVEPGVAAALEQARRTAGELSETVRGLLQQELQRGGYESALRVCSEAAQRVTREFREQRGHDVRRVSLRARNPADAPDVLERRVLEEFDRRRAAGELPVEHFEVVTSDEGVRALRYLRPLVTGALCLNCHGRPEDIPPGVSAALKEKYPNDPATGYRGGDVRGAVSVVIALPAEPAAAQTVK